MNKWTAILNKMKKLDLSGGDEDLLSIFLSSHEAYSEGRSDVGMWVALPVDEDELRKLYNLLTDKGQQDFLIADTIGTLSPTVGEYDDPFELNEVCEEIENNDDYDDIAERLVYLVKYEGCTTLRVAMDHIDDLIIHDDIDDVVNEIVEMHVSEIKDKRLQQWFYSYLDYDYIKRDLLLEGSYTEHNGKYYEYLG